ncbi:MAG: hypothetical protein BMS9Abin21_084 [Thermodesulfovibrionia bacterium]|nr:MAG: hypothetical protein BMS9Abin21_084 [Thermodesulfovibrionia bacterium]
MDEKKEYSVAKEMGIVFFVGLILGLIVLVASVGVIEIFVR